MNNQFLLFGIGLACGSLLIGTIWFLKTRYWLNFKKWTKSESCIWWKWAILTLIAVLGLELVKFLYITPFHVLPQKIFCIVLFTIFQILGVVSGIYNYDNEVAEL